MGQFQSGVWLVGLLIYFFCFFVLVFSYVNAAPLYGTPTTGVSVTDPGFSTATNQPFAQGGQCSGRPFYLCRTANIDNDTVCFSYNGCYWANNLFTDDSCKGVLEVDCRSFTNETRCQAIGCTWTDFTGIGSGQVSNSQSFDWGSVKNTIGIMTGFSATLGNPGTGSFVIYFIFFWLPFFMLLWAVYMAIPFIH